MKILCVSTSAILTPPEGYGGMERELAWLIRGLRELGDEVTVLAKTGSSIEGVIYGDSEQEFVARIADAIEEFDIVIDFSHDKLVTRTFPHIPQINTYQVMTISHRYNPVFISKAQRAFIDYPEAPVIYYGLDQDEYPIYTGPRDDYLLFLGSLIAEKRPHWAAEVGRALGLPVVIAGPRWQPEYWPKLEEIAKWPGIDVADEVSGAEKLALIQHAKCLIHPVGDKNWVEAGAIIALEALCCGTPVIATPNGCLPEYISDNLNGFLATNVEEMAHYVPRLDMITPKRCRLSIGNFTYQRMTREYRELAQEVVDGRQW